MEWLSQYWIWLVLTAGVFWLLARGRHGGRMAGCGSAGVGCRGGAGGAGTGGAGIRAPRQSNWSRQIRPSRVPR